MFIKMLASMSFNKIQSFLKKSIVKCWKAIFDPETFTKQQRKAAEISQKNLKCPLSANLTV